MQVFLNKERVGSLTKTGNTTVRLSPSVITLGGKQYGTGNLTCDIATDLDTGSVQANKVYYVYAVVQSGSVVLRASLNIANPVGYIDAKYVGAIQLSNTSQIVMVSQNNTFNTDNALFVPNSVQGFTLGVNSLRFSRLNGHLIIEGNFNYSSPLAQQMRVDLPQNLISDSNYGSVELVGEVLSTNATTTDAFVVIGSNDPYMSFGVQNGGATPLAKGLANSVLNSAETLSIKARIRIQGWTAKIGRSVEGK